MAMDTEQRIALCLSELRREIERANSKAVRGYKPKQLVLDLLDMALSTGIKGSNLAALESVYEYIRGVHELTDTQYKNMTGQVTDDRRPGFVLMPEAAGKRRWVYRYTPKGSRSAKHLTLGSAPDMSLSEARVRWEIAYSAHKRDESPEQAIAIADGAGELTVKELVHKYLLEYARKHTKPATYKGYDAILHRELVPKYGNLPATHLNQEHVREILLNICNRAKVEKNRSGIRSAQKALQAIGGMYKVATGRNRKLGNLQPWLPTGHPMPTDGVNPGQEDARIADMSRGELGTFINKLTVSNGIGETIRCVLMMVLYSFGRIAEVCNMKWGQLDLDDGVWTVPRDESKNGLVKRVMLPRQAVEMLMRRKEFCGDQGDWVFPAERDQTKPVTVDRVGTVIREHRKELGFAVGREFTPYWLRHRAMTWLKEEEASLDIRNRLSNHKDSSIDGRYTHTANMDKQAREWGQKWADYLTDCGECKK